MNNKTRVMLVDDHALFREGLRMIVSSQPDMEVVGEANDGLEAAIKAEDLKPDLILMDIQMPVCDGIEATRRIKKDQPSVIIVILTVRDDEEKLFDAIKSGAQGYLLKQMNSQELIAMLRQAINGEAAIPPRLAARMLEEFRRLSSLLPVETAGEIYELSRREQEVLGLVAEGCSDKEIATRLTISLHTVKTHLRNILSKLQVSGRREAARIAREKGLI
ncbi:MAG: response regulator [Bellilinea sp.]